MSVLPVGAYILLLILSTLVGGFLSYRGYVNRDRQGAKAFSVVAVALAAWALTEVVELVTSDLAVAATARQVRYLAIAVLPVAVLVVALQYTGHRHRLTPTALGFLLAVPAFTWLFVLTNRIHHFVWHVEGMVRVGSYTALAVTHGPWYPVHVGYSYLLLAAATVLFVRAAIRTHETYRFQALLVALGISFPWAANALYVFGPWNLRLDLTPVFFSVTGGFLGVAVLRYRFLDLAPVARDSVVEVMQEGVVVLDENRRIVDVNPAATSVLERPEEDLIGERFSDAVPDPLVEAAAADDGGTVTLGEEGRLRHFDVQISTLERGGAVLLLHDVTEQREQAARLERQNERLDRFASVLSHDLRNPLNVAQGYVDLLEEDTDSEFVPKIASSLDRMEHIVDDALALAREGRMVSDPEPVSLGDVARDAWNSVVTRGGTLTVETEAVVEADPDRVQRIFENLFRNAVEHGTADTLTRSAGAAERSASTASDGVATAPTVTVGDLPDVSGFYVADDGPGIPESEREHVFEFGYSSDEGSGLGLAIVSEIADAHGWDVTVTEGDAGGARFEFRGVTSAT